MLKGFSGIFMLLFACMSVINIHAQEKKFPVFSDQAIPKPEDLPQIKPEDFKINPERMKSYPDGFLYGDKKALDRLCYFLMNDPEGQKFWEQETKDAAKTLNRWDFDWNGFAGDRYVYRIPQLERLSFIYLFSGQKELGLFIREHVLLVSQLPIEFWLHAELRGCDPVHPIGGLETSSLCTTISTAISVTSELFSPAEKQRIDEALFNQGLVPCLNWLEKSWVNNWTAVVSSGAYVAAAYFDDEKGKAEALSAMKRYLEGSVEADGSYGEGLGYFDYPVRSLLPAILVMDQDERLQNFCLSGLRYSASWKVYPYLFATKPDGKARQTVVHFGDNSYLGDNSFIGPTQQKVNLILASLYHDKLAAWLLDRFGGELDFKERLLLYSAPEGLPTPESPAKAQLPLVKNFDSGECFIRSGWEDNSIALAMWSGNGSRVHFSHQRPELGSVCLGAYGEYLIVSPGAASYRSPLRYQWDLTTIAANTITIDDKNQLFPGTGKSSWNQTDVSDFWMQGNPKAEIVQCKTGELADVIVNELAQAYHVPMKYLRRSILFVRDPGYFVMIDNIEADESSHNYTWRIHLNNRDGQGILKEVNDNHWYFTRPFANLDIYLFANRKLETTIGEGFMHGPTRDYSPGGQNEGKPGSSIELKANNRHNTQSMIYYSVIFPTTNGLTAPKIKFAENKIVVGTDVLTFADGECTLENKGKTEKFRLWEK